MRSHLHRFCFVFCLLGVVENAIAQNGRTQNGRAQNTCEPLSLKQILGPFSDYATVNSTSDGLVLVAGLRGEDPAEENPYTQSSFKITKGSSSQIYKLSDFSSDEGDSSNSLFLAFLPLRSKSGDFVLGYDHQAQTLIELNLRTKKFRKLSGANFWTEATRLPNGAYISGRNGEFTYWKSGEPQKSCHLFECSGWTPEGQQIPASARRLEALRSLGDSNSSSDGNSLFERYSARFYPNFERQPNRYVQLEAGLQFLSGEPPVFRTENGEVFSFKEIPCGPEVQVASCDCSIEELENRARNEMSSVAQDIVNKVRCEKKFDARDWDRDTPGRTNWTRGKTSLTQEEARNYLLRFSKPGGFAIDEHFSILDAILKSDMRTSSPRLVSYALTAIAVGAPEAYEELVKRHNYTPPQPAPNDEEACRSSEERAQIRQGAFDYFMKKFGKVDGYSSTKLSDWKEALPLFSSLRHVNEAQKAEIFPRMYRSLAHGAVDDGGANEGVFVSKAIVFSKNYVKGLFGDRQLELTDLASGRNGRVYMMGTDAITYGGRTSEVNQFGYHSLEVPQSELGSSGSAEIAYTHAGKRFNGRAQTQRVTPGDYLPSGNKPDYDKMWADRELSGIVLIGDNLSHSAPRMTGSYVRYYSDEGFTFGEPQSGQDTVEFLREQIASGKADYILKEAHSQGLDGALITVAQQSRLMTGTRTLRDGRKETIHLLLPQEGTGRARWQFDDMKQWMDQRENTGQGPLFYLNSSCWSMSQAERETPAIESPLFVNIASTETTTTFVNRRESTKYHIMEGLRNGQTYEQMREGMKTTPRWQNGYNKFLFPDQDEYRSHFTRSNVSVNLSLRNADGTPYHLEESLSH